MRFAVVLAVGIIGFAAVGLYASRWIRIVVRAEDFQGTFSNIANSVDDFCDDLHNT